MFMMRMFMAFMSMFFMYMAVYMLSFMNMLMAVHRNVSLGMTI